MIKAVVTAADSKVVILGLSGQNVTRLAAGEPIRFQGDEIGIPGHMFVIMYGRTEDAMVAELTAALGVEPTTVTRVT